MVFDLDPSDDDLARSGVGRLAGGLLDDLGRTTYLKNTGPAALVPLRSNLSFDEVRGFARRCSEVLIEREPDPLRLGHRKVKRGDRVYVDLDRRTYGQTAVPAYAVRSRPGAPISTPIM